MFEIQRCNNIIIPEGEVSKITDSSGAILWQKCDYTYLPYNSEKSDAVATQVINVSVGDKVTIYFYPTYVDGGILCDASNCGGSQYYINEGVGSLNTHSAITFEASSSGKLLIAGRYRLYEWGIDWAGTLCTDPPYTKYIRIKIN